MTRRTAAAAVIALTTALTLAFAACAPLPTADPAPTASTSAASSPASTPSASASASMDAEMTPTPSASARVDPADWHASVDGIGPVLLGASFAGTLDALGATWNHDGGYCSAVAEWSAPGGGYYLAFRKTGDQISSVQVRATAAEPKRIGPRTSDGLGVGSTKADILAVAPNATTEGLPGGPGVDVVTIPGSALLRFVFFDGSAVASTMIVTSEPQLRANLCD